MVDGRARGEALALGVDFFGVADLTPALALAAERGGQAVYEFPRAVSIGVAMPSSIVGLLPRQEDTRAPWVYRSHCHDVLNTRLDQLASRLAGVLQREGHQAFPVRASARPIATPERLHGLFSHKLAAHLAGLGWIGKSCLLVTPEVGPRVRWASVLTDAPLSTGDPLGERCGDCTECFDACPPRALLGRNFRADEPREARFDAHSCHAYLTRRGETMGVRVCGLCVYACPHGRKP